MKVFDNLDKEQAGMYRWMRKNLTKSMYERLTHLPYDGQMSEMDIDIRLKMVYEMQQCNNAPHDIQHRSKIRSGIFPAQLGAALENFVEARIEQAFMFAERDGLSGNDNSVYDAESKTTFLMLCEEMAKLR